MCKVAHTDALAVGAERRRLDERLDERRRLVPHDVRAEDGSGVGAALIAALTIKRVKEGQLAGIQDREAMLKMAGQKPRSA